MNFYKDVIVWLIGCYVIVFNYGVILNNVIEIYNLMQYDIVLILIFLMYCLYNCYIGEYLYILNVGEKNYLLIVGWEYEGIVW